MITLARNAEGVEDAYREGLATCFPGAWDEASYRWYLARPFQSWRPDRVTAHDGERIVAGVGVNYRRVRCASGRVRSVGILTGAWTLPNYRGRGCFLRLIEASAEMAAERGCSALLSFVTTSNASASCLKRAGAVPVAARYLLFSSADRPPPQPELPARPTTPEAASALFATAASAVAFHYETPDEWAEQFIERPRQTELLDVGAERAVVERVGATDRVQFLSSPDSECVRPLVALANRSHEAGRDLFCFTTNLDAAERAAQHGFRQTEGAIMVIDLGSDTEGATSRPTLLSSSPWSVQSGDRM